MLDEKAALIQQESFRMLRNVIEPQSGKSIVELGWIRNLMVDGEGNIVFQLYIPDNRYEGIDSIVRKCREELSKIDGVADVSMEVRGPHGERMNTGLDRVKKKIAVASGKGGVGKSTIATALAFALRSRGSDVGLLDADIYGPSTPYLLGTEKEKLSVSDGMIQPLNSGGIKTVSIGYMVPRGEALIWRGPLLHKVLSQFFYDVNWGELDYLVVDLPPGTGDVQLSMVQQMRVDGIVLVSTPQRLAVEDVLRAKTMFEKTDTKILGVILNMTYLECPKCNCRIELFQKEKIEREIGLPVLAELPFDLAVSNAGAPVEAFYVSLRSQMAEVAEWLADKM